MAGNGAVDSFSFQEGDIEGLKLIDPLYVADSRGYFSKTYEAGLFARYGIPLEVAEELESRSAQYTLRGLHFQHRNSQDKLIRVLSGEIYDVAVDIRPDSASFGRWPGFRLSAENRRMLYIPKGFAHGFLALREDTAVHYLCGGQYDSASEDGILWNDPELAIPWPLEYGQRPLLSQRDQGFQTLDQFRRALHP